jgi:outer membrane protein OmpA-like peptidoglycan-associated protein
MQVLRRGGLLVVGMMGLALLLGGCSKNKQADLAQTEAAELRERLAAQEEAIRQKDAQIAQLQQGGDTGTDTADAPRQRRVSNDETPVFHKNSGGMPQATLSGDVLFASGSADIKADAKKSLDKIAAEIKRDYAGATIRVEGYTDSDPLVKAKKKWGTNENLSEARAESVKKYLATKGVKSSRVETFGFGSAKPKATKAQSRRVEIIVVQ